MRSIAAIGILTLAGAAFAQTDSTGPEFEVASVKVAKPLPNGMVMFRMGDVLQGRDPSRIDLQGVTLKNLAASAYGVKEYQVEGPAWIDSERYDIVATIPEGSDKEKVKLMMQHLLAQRFHLTIHKESKSINVYTLSVAKPEKMQPVDPATLPAAPPPREGSAVPPPPPPPRGRGDGGPPNMPSGPLPSGASRMMMTPTGRQYQGSVTIERLVEMLTNLLDKPVLDLTSLKGIYSIDLAWTPTESESMGGRVGPAMAAAMAQGGRGGDPAAAPASEPGPTLAEALMSKYGLKLEAKKNPADLIVIDSADKVPTEN